MNKIIAKSMFIWLAIIPLAVANGALRERVLSPLLGRAALPVSGVLLAIAIFVMAFIFIPRLGPLNRYAAVKIGIAWLVATLLFETIMGLALWNSPAEILRNYNISNGNLWLLVVIFIAFVPSIVIKLR